MVVGDRIAFGGENSRGAPPGPPPHCDKKDPPPPFDCAQPTVRVPPRARVGCVQLSCAWEAPGESRRGSGPEHEHERRARAARTSGPTCTSGGPWAGTSGPTRPDARAARRGPWRPVLSDARGMRCERTRDSMGHAVSIAFGAWGECMGRANNSNEPLATMVRVGHYQFMEATATGRGKQKEASNGLAQALLFYIPELAEGLSVMRARNLEEGMNRGTLGERAVWKPRTYENFHRNGDASQLQRLGQAPKRQATQAVA